MPQLWIKGVSAEQLRPVSTALIDELADICACGRDNFTIDVLQTISVYDGQIVEAYPFVEVAWFERGQAVRDRFAEALTKHMLAAGAAEVEVAFKVYQEEAYYINGRPCSS
ncbi:hypothetical protein FHS18_004116 [Paenibacillus phyllosphaerae]|uniref:DUF1904 domain-containing protein n=1 Tax=Paenibacillus phyllosphaerae TaxID=274593 RepID=A0A7W5B084_9BACL|nr:hypothetical protein [Paenibacillus phyllosphaerae]